MSVKSFLSSCKRLVKFVNRPNREEVWTYIKIGLIGTGIIGFIGLIVKLLASMLQATQLG